MKHTRTVQAAIVGLIAVGMGVAPFLTVPQPAGYADCPYGWYWDDERQNCLPPGLPKDPPNGCLTGDGTHFTGTICVN